MAQKNLALAGALKGTSKGPRRDLKGTSKGPRPPKPIILLSFTVWYSFVSKTSDCQSMKVTPVISRGARCAIIRSNFSVPTTRVHLWHAMTEIAFVSFFSPCQYQWIHQLINSDFLILFASFCNICMNPNLQLVKRLKVSVAMRRRPTGLILVAFGAAAAFVAPRRPALLGGLAVVVGRPVAAEASWRKESDLRMEN